MLSSIKNHMLQTKMESILYIFRNAAIGLFENCFQYGTVINIKRNQVWGYFGLLRSREGGGKETH